MGRLYIYLHDMAQIYGKLQGKYAPVPWSTYGFYIPDTSMGRLHIYLHENHTNEQGITR